MSQRFSNRGESLDPFGNLLQGISPDTQCRSFESTNRCGSVIGPAANVCAETVVISNPDFCCRLVGKSDPTQHRINGDCHVGCHRVYPIREIADCHLFRLDEMLAIPNGNARLLAVKVIELLVQHAAPDSVGHIALGRTIERSWHVLRTAKQLNVLSQLTEGVVQPVIRVDLMRRCALKLISRKPPNVHADVRDVVAAGAARYAAHIQQVRRPLKRAPEADSAASSRRSGVP